MPRAPAQVRYPLPNAPAHGPRGPWTEAPCPFCWGAATALGADGDADAGPDAGAGAGGTRFACPRGHRWRIDPAGRIVYGDDGASIAPSPW